MKNRIIIIVLLIGFCAIGYTGAWFQFKKYPDMQAEKSRNEYQAALNKMACSGTIVALDDKSVTVKLSKGVIKKYLITPYTTGQIDDKIINQPGETLNLSESYKLGQKIEILAEKDQVLVIARSK